MRNQVMGLMVCSALLGCNTAEDVGQLAPAAAYHVNRNYQAVYASLIAAGRTCYQPGPGFVGDDYQMNTDLFPDLGYGEISYTVAGPLTAFTSSVIRIQKDGSGAQVIVKDGTGHPAQVGRMVEWQKFWINGGHGCPTLGAMHPPSA
ncbi:MAG: hypothetical protein ACOH2H_15150 [Cypionkella sp.]